MRALATLCALLASGCHLILDLDDHEVGGASASGTGAAGAGGSAAASSSGPGGATGDGGSAGHGTVQAKTLTITDNQDDCVWTIDKQGSGMHHERLVFDQTNWRIFVGTDSDMQRFGLRFPIGELAGAQVVSAYIVLAQESGNDAEPHPVRIRVWDAADVDPFVHNHMHGPEGHGPGFWANELVWTTNGDQASASTPDLSQLVQHVIDHPDFASERDPHVGFVFSPGPGGTDWWIGYQDSSSPGDQPPRLVLEYLQ